MKNFLKSLLAIDKLAHFGWGAMICAAVVLVCLLQEVSGPLSWSAVWVCLIGTIVAVVLEICNDFIVDMKWDWADVVATVLGTLVIWVATAIGIWFNIIAQGRDW